MGIDAPFPEHVGEIPASLPVLAIAWVFGGTAVDFSSDFRPARKLAMRDSSMATVIKTAATTKPAAYEVFIMRAS